VRIPHLEDISLKARVIVAAVVLIIVFLLLLAATYFVEAQNAKAQSLVLILPPSKWDAEMLELERQALREAYVDKMKQLFNVWVSGGLDDPQRPVKGAAQTRRAFIEIKKIQEQREQELEDRQQK